MPSMLKTVLGGNKKRKSPEEEGNAPDLEGSSSGSDSDSDDSESDSDDSEDSEESDSESEGEPREDQGNAERLPNCLEAAEKAKWMQDGQLTCLICPDKKIRYLKGDPWQFHIATKAHARRLKRYQLVVQSMDPAKFPEDPRDLVRSLDVTVKERQESMVRIRKWRKQKDPQKQAKMQEKIRLRKINKADKKANREHRKRAKAGLPHDPSIDEQARQTKLKLGWDPVESKKKKEESDRTAKERLENLPAWKVGQLIHKAEKKQAKAHKKNEKTKKPYDPAIDEKVEQLKQQLHYDPKIHFPPRIQAKRAKAKKNEQPWQGRGSGHQAKKAKLDSGEKGGFFIDEFGSGADHISLDAGAPKQFKAKDSGEKIKKLR